MNWEGVGQTGGKGETAPWIAEDSWKSEKERDPRRGQKMALGRIEEFMSRGSHFLCPAGEGARWACGHVYVESD